MATPKANPYCESLSGQRVPECLDDVNPLTERRLRRVLAEWYRITNTAAHTRDSAPEYRPVIDHRCTIVGSPDSQHSSSQGQTDSGWSLS
jgi:hypothetical protein